MNRNEEYLNLVKELEENTPDLRVSVQKARNKRTRIAFVYRPLASLAVCFALFVLLVNFSAPVAQACSRVPILRELAEAVTFSRPLSDAVENDYVQPVDLAQEQNGVTAEIEYLIVDRKQVHVFYRLESEEYKAMYVVPKIMNKEGTDKEPCTWTTPINDVANEELRLITLDYNEEEIPNSLQVIIRAYDSRGYSTEKLAEFTFLLEFDPNQIAEAKIYPIDQTVVMDGQTITVTEIQVYPTHLRLNVADAAENTCWLNMLDFYIETELGRFDASASGVIATGTADSKSMTSYRADSLYFYEAEQIQLVITGARWLSKDMEKIHIDLSAGETEELPQGVTLVSPDDENSMSPVMLHVCCDWDQRQHVLLSMAYYDAGGARCQASVSVRDCREHDANCWYEWLVLEDYPDDEIWICPTYTHGWAAEEPITITVQG